MFAWKILERTKAYGVNALKRPGLYPYRSTAFAGLSIWYGSSGGLATMAKEKSR
jgi:hypothetical protein